MPIVLAQEADRRWSVLRLVVDAGESMQALFWVKAFGSCARARACGYGCESLCVFVFVCVCELRLAAFHIAYSCIQGIVDSEGRCEELDGTN